MSEEEVVRRPGFFTRTNQFVRTYNGNKENGTTLMNLCLRLFVAFCAFVNVFIFVGNGMWQKKHGLGMSGLTVMGIVVNVLAFLLSIFLFSVALVHRRTQMFAQVAYGVVNMIPALYINGLACLVLLIVSTAVTVSANTAGCKDPDSDPHADVSGYTDDLPEFCRNKRAGAAFFWIMFFAWLWSLAEFMWAFYKLRRITHGQMANDPDIIYVDAKQESEKLGHEEVLFDDGHGNVVDANELPYQQEHQPAPVPGGMPVPMPVPMPADPALSSAHPMSEAAPSAAPMSTHPMSAAPATMPVPHIPAPAPAVATPPRIRGNPPRAPRYDYYYDDGYDDGYEYEYDDGYDYEPEPVPRYESYGRRPGPRYAPPIAAGYAPPVVAGAGRPARESQPRRDPFEDQSRRLFGVGDSESDVTPRYRR